MTPGQQRQKLQGQPTITRKIFEHVPIQEAWTSPQISQSLARACGSRLDAKTVGRCVRELLNSGLVRAVIAGHYQRVPVSKGSNADSSAETPVTETPKEPTTMPQETKPSAIDVLAGIAKSMRALASDIETAALSIEEGSAKSSEELGKLRQLQALLKGLA